MLVLDLQKQGRGPLITKTVAATVMVVFISVLYSTLEIQKRFADGGINHTDEVLLANLCLEASLIGNYFNFQCF